MSWFNWLKGGTPAPKNDTDTTGSPEAAVAITGGEELDTEPCVAEAEAEVSAAEVHRAFRVNQVAAEDRFQASAFVVVGEVRSVQRDYHGQAQVNLAVDDFNALAVLYPDEARELVSKLEPGVEVRMRVRVKESCTRGDVKLEAVETA